MGLAKKSPSGILTVDMERTGLVFGGVEKMRPGETRASISTLGAVLFSGFYLRQAVSVGLIKDGKIGAGAVRAAKIAQVLASVGGK